MSNYQDEFFKILNFEKTQDCDNSHCKRTTDTIITCWECASKISLEMDSTLYILRDVCLIHLMSSCRDPGYTSMDELCLVAGGLTADILGRLSLLFISTNGNAAWPKWLAGWNKTQKIASQENNIFITRLFLLEVPLHYYKGLLINRYSYCLTIVSRVTNFPQSLSLSRLILKDHVLL